MNAHGRSCWHACVGCLLIATGVTGTGWARAAAATVTVHPQRRIPSVQAFARVQPMTVASLRAGLDGRIRHLDIVPGSHVDAGQRIGALGGSPLRERLSSDRAALKAARDIEQTARQSLAIARQRLAQHLSTRDQVGHATSEAARATASRVQARQTLASDQALSLLKSPTDGTVIDVLAHAGERVHRDQLLARIQPKDALWLTASFYDPHARTRLHIGMRGTFRPDDGSADIAVQVMAIPPRLHDDGGQPVILKRVDHRSRPRWVNGETGRLRLDGQPVMRILVPSRALVLDRGQWWVLLDTSAGDRRVRVTPGARDGQRTVITQGLHDGDRVVVDHVYQRFHRGISRRYQQQD